MTARELLEGQVERLTVNGRAGNWRHVAEVDVVHGSLGFRIWAKKRSWLHGEVSDTRPWGEPHDVEKVWVRGEKRPQINRLLMHFDPPIVMQPGECIFVPVFDADEREKEEVDV